MRRTRNSSHFRPLLIPASINGSVCVVCGDRFAGFCWLHQFQSVRGSSKRGSIHPPHPSPRWLDGACRRCPRQRGDEARGGKWRLLLPMMRLSGRSVTHVSVSWFQRLGCTHTPATAHSDGSIQMTHGCLLLLVGEGERTGALLGTPFPRCRIA